MKWSSFIFGLATLPGWMMAQDFAVSPAVTIAAGQGNYHPQAEVLGDGQLGVIWSDPSNNSLYFSRQTGTTAFTVPLKLNPDGLDVQVYNWSGADLAVWGNDVYVVFRSLGYETGHVYLVKSSDNGLTFGDTVRVDNIPGGYSQYPDVAVFNDTVYVTHMKHDIVTHIPQYVVSRSVDGGLTFGAAVDVTEWLGMEVCDCCQPEILADADRIIVFFRENDLNTRDIKAVISNDRGVTFNEYVPIDDHNWTISACPSTGPDARFTNGNVTVCAYKTNVSGQPRLFVDEYDHAASTSLNTIEIYMDGASTAGINYPQVAVSGPYLGIVWEGLGQGTDVYFNASQSGASGLLPSVAINVTDVTGSQSKPDIAITPDGYHIVYAELTGAEVKYCRINALNDLPAAGKPEVEIFPNPFESAVVIRWPLTDVLLRATVLSTDGRVITEPGVAGQGELAIDLEALPTGVYLLRLDFSSGSYLYRLVKEGI